MGMVMGRKGLDAERGVLGYCVGADGYEIMVHVISIVALSYKIWFETSQT